MIDGRRFRPAHLLVPVLVGLGIVAVLLILVGRSRASPGSNASAANSTLVTIPTGGGSAPTLTVPVPVSPQSPASISAAATHAGSTAASVAVGSDTDSQATPAGFVGLSVEFSSVEPYAAAGSLFSQMIENLSPGQPPVIRIGGDSTDHSGVPIPGYHNTGVWGNWGSTWMGAARQLAVGADARLVIGLNLEVNNAEVPIAEARTMAADIGPRYIAAFELGNEPDLYSVFPWYAFHDDPFYTRTKSWSPAEYIKQLKGTVGALGGVALWGPTLGANSSWWSSLPQIAAAVPHLTTITYHAYPTSCYAAPSAPNSPSVAHLLAPASSTGLADAMKPEIGFAAKTHRQVRVDEINTVTCAGTEGITSFASALWAMEAGFALDKVGVHGLDVHMFPKAVYRLFTFSHNNTAVSAADEYYGWLMFNRAAPTGSRELTSTTTGNAHVHAYATKAGSADNVVLINDSPDHSATVTLSVPASSLATVQPLRAPGLSAPGGVSFDGLTISPSTGQLTGHARLTAVSGAGQYSVFLPPASADLVTATR